MSDSPQNRPQRFRYELRDEPRDLVLLGAPRPCQACGEPCLTATPRQRTKGTHPTCFHDGWKWGLTEAAEMKVLQTFAKVFQGHITSWGPEKPRPKHDGPRTWHSDIPCICGATDDVVLWRGCREYQEPYAVYRCFTHPPYRIPIQSWEVQAR